MTEYLVLIPGNEASWEAATAEQHEAVYSVHSEFNRLLAERGHKVRSAGELSPSRGAKVLRSGADGVTVTDGPYAESVEQLTGFYFVESDDLDDLLEICHLLAPVELAIEVRAVNEAT